MSGNNSQTPQMNSSITYNAPQNPDAYGSQVVDYRHTSGGGSWTNMSVEASHQQGRCVTNVNTTDKDAFYAALDFVSRRK